MKGYITLVKRGSIERVEISSICYIQQQQRKLEILTAKRERYRVYGQVRDYEDCLDEGFVFIRKYTVVNLSHVKKMENCWITFANDECLWVGKNNFIKARRMFNDFLEKNLANADEL